MTRLCTVEGLAHGYIRGTILLPGRSIETETFRAYSEIFSILADRRLHLVKCHNFIPNILALENDQPRYHRFNSGRGYAFERAGYTVRPAACGVGAPHGRDLEIRFIAGPTVPQELENPRQTAAYQYPAQYGTTPPLFSRAVLDGRALYVSGTASIRGHDTVHPGDFVAQYHETLDNLMQLMRFPHRLASFYYTIYTPHAFNIPTIQAHFPYPARYVVCDLCRDDLLVEIEATSHHGYDILALHP